MYNKLRKTKNRQFKAEVINKLDSLYMYNKDPKQYW